MNITHIVPSIEEEASGPSYSVQALNIALRSLGAHSRIAVTGVAPAISENIYTFPRQKFVFRLGRSPEMLRWLRNEANGHKIDILHSHSLWMMPNVYPGWVSRRSGTPLIVSPRGTLSSWALQRSRYTKFAFWYVLQKRAIENATLFHVTSEDEYKDVRRAGFGQPVAIIPNGINVAPGTPSRTVAEKKTLLFLGRIHPVKGVDNLLRAWVAVQQKFPQWHLLIVGPGDADYLREMLSLATALGAARTNFHGPLYGADKIAAFRAADLFVLPTYSENFGIAVAEALAAECPVITTKGAPWSGLISRQAGWWIDIGVAPLVSAFEQAMSQTPETLRAMGAAGRVWMQDEFSWQNIGSRMVATYSWVQNGGPIPPWIRIG